MIDPRIIPLANHILSSIQKDLVLLKDHQVLDDQTLQHILTLLPPQATVLSANPSLTIMTIKPPLPTRKPSTNSLHPVPIPAPRTPKLPTRRTSEWQKQQSRIIANEQIPVPPNYTATVKNNLQAEAIFDYSGENPNTDLSFHKGDTIQVTEHVNNDWWRGTLHGKSGIFPQNHVQLVPTPKKSPKTFQEPPDPSVMPRYPMSIATESNSVTVEETKDGDGNVQNMAKKFGSRVGEAAIFGFGATVGSEAAHAIF